MQILKLKEFAFFMTISKKILKKEKEYDRIIT